MKTIKYVPSQAKGENAEFEGYVELRLPLFEEKLAYMEEFGLDVDEDGKVSTGDRKKNMGLLIKMIKVARQHYVSIALKHLPSGVEYKAYEDLSCDPECHGVVTEIAGAVLNGLKVGNA
jgi:hypothetical protein